MTRDERNSLRISERVPENQLSTQLLTQDPVGAHAICLVFLEFS